MATGRRTRIFYGARRFQRYHQAIHTHQFLTACLTQARGDGYVSVMSWYDNEWGYSNRCVDLILKMHELSNN